MRRARIVPRLGRHQAVIGAALGHQFAMPALFHYPALAQNQNAVGIYHGGQTMSEDQRRAALHQAVQGLLDHRLVFRINRGQRLVQHQDRRIAQQGPGDGDTLALATR